MGLLDVGDEEVSVEPEPTVRTVRTGMNQPPDDAVNLLPLLALCEDCRLERETVS